MLKKLTGPCSWSSILKAVAYQDFSKNHMNVGCFDVVQDEEDLLMISLKLCYPVELDEEFSFSTVLILKGESAIAFSFGGTAFL